MILCLGATPAAQRVMLFQRLTLDAVNRAVNTLDGAAGKSVNVAKVLQVLGAEPLAAGFIGGDRGGRILATLRERGIKTEFITVPARTRECVTLIDQSTGAVTELVEESQAVDLVHYDQLREILHRHLPQCQAVVLSGTLTRGAPADFYAECVRVANAAGMLTAVDAQGEPLLRALEAGPGLVKPNLQELAATLGRELRGTAEVTEGMRELHSRGARRVIITAGSAPTLAFDGEVFWEIQSAPVKAANPIGSGDAFTAGVVWRLALGENLGDACRWGAACGAANALTWMAGEVLRADVERLVSHVTADRLLV